MLLGPAYKGITLAAVTAAALYDIHAIDVPYAYNRKEAKNHGEEGGIVCAALEGKVLIIDDVMTAGTSVREVMQIITYLKTQYDRESDVRDIEVYRQQYGM